MPKPGREAQFAHRQPGVIDTVDRSRWLPSPSPPFVRSARGTAARSPTGASRSNSFPIFSLERRRGAYDIGRGRSLAT